MTERTKIPSRYQPKGFHILYEDEYVIVGNKAPGHLTVRAHWNKDDTIHSALNAYVRKGNSRSRKVVYVVHRLDQDTSGVMVYAKTEKAQQILKEKWKDTKKIYFAVVQGHFEEKSGTISSYLVEDDDYMVRSSEDDTGKLARTAYTVVKESKSYSLLRIKLLTGRKNQIRVHCAEAGHPLVGDAKYGTPDKRHPQLALHSQSLSFAHPFTGKRVTFETPLPDHMAKLVGGYDIGPGGSGPPKPKKPPEAPF